MLNSNGIHFIKRVLYGRQHTFCLNSLFNRSVAFLKIKMLFLATFLLCAGLVTGRFSKT